MLLVLILVALWFCYRCQCFLLVALCLGLGGMVGGIVPRCQCCLLLVYAPHCAPLGLLGHYWALGSSSLPTLHTFYYYLLSRNCATAGQNHLICFAIYTCNYDSQLLWKPIRFPPPKKYTPLTSLISTTVPLGCYWGSPSSCNIRLWLSQYSTLRLLSTRLWQSPHCHYNIPLMLSCATHIMQSTIISRTLAHTGPPLGRTISSS